MPRRSWAQVALVATLAAELPQQPAANSGDRHLREGQFLRPAGQKWNAQKVESTLTSMPAIGVVLFQSC
jgi:hypothetical protein